MAVETTSVYERELRIEARPETVFAYFTDPARMTRWKGIAATLDPRPGGIYRVEVVPGHVALGEYVEVDPPRRLVFTWGWEGDGPVPPGGSTIEVTLTPDGAGTILRFVHGGLTEEAAASHRDGWEHYLPRLEVVAAGGDAGPDPWAQGS